MIKKHFWKLEYSIVLFVCIGLFMLLAPISFGNTRQAGFIAKWNEKINRVEYMFSVINAHVSDDMLKSIKRAKNPQEREALLLAVVKPYLRINTKTRPKHYKPRYKNGSKVYKGQMYYFDDFYFAENNNIVGIKDVKTEKEGDALFIMMFDVNGLLPPNRWGNDIFGVTIFNDKIEPFGYDMSMDELKKDCSNAGFGVSCSYYYKIGGDFDD